MRVPSHLSTRFWRRSKSFLFVFLEKAMHKSPSFQKLETFPSSLVCRSFIQCNGMNVSSSSFPSSIITHNQSNFGPPLLLFPPFSSSSFLTCPHHPRAHASYHNIVFWPSRSPVTFENRRISITFDSPPPQPSLVSSGFGFVNCVGLSAKRLPEGFVPPAWPYSSKSTWLYFVSMLKETPRWNHLTSSFCFVDLPDNRILLLMI